MTKIFVGGLNDSITKFHLEDGFARFGRIEECCITTRQTGCFAYIMFERPRDAADAIKVMNKSVFKGSRLRVEYAQQEHSSAYGNGEEWRSNFRGGQDRNVHDGGQHRNVHDGSKDWNVRGGQGWNVRDGGQHRNIRGGQDRNVRGGQDRMGHIRGGQDMMRGIRGDQDRMWDIRGGHDRMGNIRGGEENIENIRGEQDRLRDIRGRQGRNSETQCFNCGNFGHLSRHCNAKYKDYGSSDKGTELQARRRSRSLEDRFNNKVEQQPRQSRGFNNGEQRLEPDSRFNNREYRTREENNFNNRGKHRLRQMSKSMENGFTHKLDNHQARERSVSPKNGINNNSNSNNNNNNNNNRGNDRTRPRSRSLENNFTISIQQETSPGWRRVESKTRRRVQKQSQPHVEPRPEPSYRSRSKSPPRRRSKREHSPELSSGRDEKHFNRSHSRKVVDESNKENSVTLNKRSKKRSVEKDLEPLVWSECHDEEVDYSAQLLFDSFNSEEEFARRKETRRRSRSFALGEKR